jgi:nitroimidazol reductase NimA-like FMN-containing flavoprotein (pyridoxamine 5'-phosphate oxidase superfamily)
MDFNADLIHIRRQDRAVNDDAWIEAFLQRIPFGVVAMSVQDQPFVNTNNFVYDPGRRAIYFHHASEGRTLATLEQNPRVCFTAAEMGRLLPAPQSRGFSVEYGSVVAYGRAVRVLDPAEMLHGLGLLMAKYAPHLQPGRDYRNLTADELAGVAVIRIDIAAWTAKRKTAPDDFPGAYRLP